MHAGKSFHPPLDLARAPRRAPLTARKKGSGYENGVTRCNDFHATRNDRGQRHAKRLGRRRYLAPNCN